ncbi:MAG TPA: class I tRNA ligase family protein, partial [Bacillota bacterium]|nr:class I tRNA ligase family protein [Bacillota bacterium]
GAKMSKSKGNVVSPDEIIERYGADTGRLFILFASPPEKDLEWSDQGVEGCHRFLRRVWRLVKEGRALADGERDAAVMGKEEKELRRIIHSGIKKVTEDIQERFNFNTAISAIMEMVNAAYNYLHEREKGGHHPAVWREALESIVLLLAPFAPHLAEELWSSLGHRESVFFQPWPEYDPQLLRREEVEIVIQINGKVRGKMTVPVDCSQEELVELARGHQRIGELLQGKEIRRAVAVPGKLVNLVIG